ncbi:MAG: presqualene diphosphate synthase HpnD [Pseudomonadota bacterium]
MTQSTDSNYAYCEEKAAKSGSSFYYSFRFLPTERRQAITALYAFCREVDDVVDECSEASVASKTLDWWRDEINNLFQDNPQHPVTRALRNAIHDYALPQAIFNDIIDGMRMDLTQHRYLDFASLEIYCYRVAGAVGLLAARIFGYSHPNTLEYAKSLGTALQLTNILRDIGEDARRDRLYLPLNELQAHNIQTHDMLNGNPPEQFDRFYQEQIERAERYYAQALQQLPDADRAAQRPGLIMAHIYHALLQELRTEGRAVFKQRITLTPIRKLWIAWKTWRRYA